MKSKNLPALLVWLLLVATTPAAPEEVSGSSFRIFAPNKGEKKILQFTVRKYIDRIVVDESAALPLPFSPVTTTLHPGGKHLIITNGGKGTPVSATAEISGSGGLRLIGSAPLTHPSGYTSIDRSGRFFMTAHYRSGSLSTYEIGKDGAVGKLLSATRTPLREAHCILTTPDNRFAYVPCVKNNNALFQYAFDADTGGLSPLEPFDAAPPAQFGPRHVVYHPDLPIAYFSNEQQLGVSVYEIGEDGQLDDKQHATTIARRSPYKKGVRDFHASDLIISPDGKLLFVALRDFVSDGDSVFTFEVGSDGRLRKTARTPVGDIPWKLGISPDGSYLLVSEITESRLSIFAIRPAGALVPAAVLDWRDGVRDFAVVRGIH